MSRIPKYKDIPYGIRKNPERLWNFLADLLNDSEENSSESQPSRNISIIVNDGADPVQGATVVIGQNSKTTGSAGGCSFNDLTDGSYEVTVTAEGYVEKTETITVSSGNTSFTISLTADENPEET